METAISYENRSGKTLFSIVHEPVNTLQGSKTGIIILNPGLKYRVAPHRLNVKLARKLCDMGYFVLRFDPAGIGDSEGELPANMPVADLWGQIQRGLFLNDTVDTVNMMISRWDLDRLYLIGSCGGAITSLLAAASIPRTDGICLIDIPIFQWDTNSTLSDIIVGGHETRQLFSGYIKKIADLKAWYKLLTLNFDFRTAWKVVTVTLRNHLLPQKIKIKESDLARFCADKKLNYEFFEGIDSVLSRNTPVLFVTAGNDHGRDTFETYFKYSLAPQKYGSNMASNSLIFTLIENANHVYTLSEWQNELFQAVFEWLHKNN